MSWCQMYQISVNATLERVVYILFEVLLPMSVTIDVRHDVIRGHT